MLKKRPVCPSVAHWAGGEGGFWGGGTIVCQFNSYYNSIGNSIGFGHDFLCRKGEKKLVSARVGQREIELWRSSDVGGCVQLHRTTINESADYGRKGGERERKRLIFKCIPNSHLLPEIWTSMGSEGSKTKMQSSTRIKTVILVFLAPFANRE